MLLRFILIGFLLIGASGIAPLCAADITGTVVIERKLTNDNAAHNLLQRPRDVPVRTGLGMMVRAKKLAQHEQVKLDFIHLQPAVQNVVHLARLDEFLLAETPAPVAAQ